MSVIIASTASRAESSWCGRYPTRRSRRITAVLPSTVVSAANELVTLMPRTAR